MYHEAPPLDPHWVRELQGLAPRSDRLSWLHITWRPDWERWCIWQMTPAHAAPGLVFGPDTRCTLRPEMILGRRFIRMATDPHHRLVLNRRNMTRYAWALHQQYGCYPQPFWVVQGNQGGHKWQFSEEESRLAGINGFPEDPPEPGTLCYAPLDHRVLEKLAPLDMLLVWNALSKAKHEMDERDLDAMERDAMIAGRWHLWMWMESQVDRGFEESGVRIAPDPAYGYQDRDCRYEEQQEEFITSDT